ncbi:MAG: helix-turn-helix transcriptional regulator [Hydrogenoanaerobacterium sp.]
MFIPNAIEIKNRREKLGLTKTQLAKKSSLPANAIGRIENGMVSKTQALRACAIAKTLKCQVTDIFIDEKENER